MRSTKAFILCLGAAICVLAFRYPYAKPSAIVRARPPDRVDPLRSVEATRSSVHEGAVLDINSLDGFVYDASANLFCPGSDVVLTFTSGSFAVRADEEGRFELDGSVKVPLSAVGWASVKAGDASSLFEGLVFGGSALQVSAMPLIDRQGPRLVGLEGVRQGEWSVSVRYSEHGPEYSGTVVGTGRVQADGETMLALPNGLPPQFMLSMILSLDGLPVLARHVSVQDVADNVAIECGVSWLDVVVRDEGGLPLRGSEVRVAGASLPGSILPAVGYADSSGTARFLVEEGRVELGVNVDGYSPAVREIDQVGDSATVEVVLRREQAVGPTISGHVFDEGGKPLADAAVAVFPSSRHLEVSTGGVRRTVTDNEGGFLLPAPSANVAMLHVFHRDEGALPVVEVASGVVDLSLRYDVQNTVSIEVYHQGCTPGVLLPGPLSYSLVHQTKEFGLSGFGFPHIKVRGVPPGDYNVYVRLPGGAGYGSASFAVPRVGVVTERVVVEPGVWVEGGIGEQGAGIVVHVEHPDWPDSLESSWGSCLVDTNGRYRVFSGSEEMPVVEDGDGDVR